MTRINLIDPKYLTDQHLLAEYRELPRIITHVEKHGISKDIPINFCLGPGHVKFFTNKLFFLCNRHIDIAMELKYRSFKLNNYSWTFLINRYFNLKNIIEQMEWEPTQKDIMISNKRLSEKISQKPDFYTYYGNKIKLHQWKEAIDNENNNKS